MSLRKAAYYVWTKKLKVKLKETPEDKVTLAKLREEFVEKHLEFFDYNYKKYGWADHLENTGYNHMKGVLPIELVQKEMLREGEHLLSKSLADGNQNVPIISSREQVTYTKLKCEGDAVGKVGWDKQDGFYFNHLVGSWLRCMFPYQKFWKFLLPNQCYVLGTTCEIWTGYQQVYSLYGNGHGQTNFPSANQQSCNQYMQKKKKSIT